MLAVHGLTFDYVGILPRHLEHVPILAERLPTLRIVVDHLGKPPIAVGGFEPWASLLAAAAKAPNVFAKLSGLDAGQGDRWSASDLTRYVDHALTVFGPDRLMYGSDWPVFRRGIVPLGTGVSGGGGGLRRLYRRRRDASDGNPRSLGSH